MNPAGATLHLDGGARVGIRTSVSSVEAQHTAVKVKPLEHLCHP